MGAKRLVAFATSLALLGGAVAALPAGGATGSAKAKAFGDADVKGEVDGRVGIRKEGAVGVVKKTGVSYARVVKCGFGVGAFAVGNAVLIAKLRKAGGIKRLVTRILIAKNNLARLEALATAFGEVAGIQKVASECGI